MSRQSSGNPNPTNNRQPLGDEPVKIRAAALELREKDKMATFTGDVYVLQGDTEMRCKVLVVSYEAETDTRTANAAIGADVQIAMMPEASLIFSLQC
jgi:lipopolysaccharide export system protein LptA